MIEKKATETYRIVKTITKKGYTLSNESGSKPKVGRPPKDQNKGAK
jgi:hypothetical protein